MRGLLARARRLRDTTAEQADTQPEGEPAFDEAGVSPEKKREILAQIERIVAQQRKPVPATALQAHAPKRGLLLPIVLNASIAALTLAVILVAARYFRVRQERLSDQAASYLSTEGRLVDTIRRESEEKLRQKDAEIAGIQQELNRLDQESENLKTTMDQRVGAREAQLRAQMDALLEAERKKLLAQGMQSAEIDRRLGQLASDKARDQARDLEAYRSTLAAEAAAREAEIEKARAQALESLKKADLERVILLEAQKGAEDAAAGFGSERQALRDQISGAERKLRDLEETARREQLVTDQILGYYARVIDEISGSRYEQARQDLVKFRRYLTDPALDALPAIAKRKQVDLFLIAALQAVVAPEYFEGLQSRELLAAVVQRVKDAQKKAEGGDQAGARSLYTEALGMVASVEMAIAALGDIDTKQRTQLLRESVARSSRALQGGDITAAAQEFRGMLDVLPPEHRTLFAEALGNLERAFGTRETASLAEKDAGLSEARAELERRVAELGAEAVQRETKAREEAAVAERAAAAAKADDLTKRLDELARFETATSTLTRTYEAGASRARVLLGGERPDPSRAGVLLADAFRSEAAGKLFPGLPEVLGLLSSSLESTARNSGYSAGYKTAMDDIVDYTAYVGGSGTEQADAARSRLLARVEADPAFRSAVGEIQGLVGKEGPQVRFVQATSRLLGSVASVTGDRVVVETLVKAAATSGAKIEVRRVNALGKEETVGRGVVESVEGQRCAARLDKASDGTTPRARVSDAVYVSAE